MASFPSEAITELLELSKERARETRPEYNPESLHIAYAIGLPWFLIAVARLAGYLPAWLINIRAREYWLHDERRVASLAYVRYWISWIAVSASLFMMAVSQEASRSTGTT